MVSFFRLLHADIASYRICFYRTVAENIEKEQEHLVTEIAESDVSID
jgi:hypothetical protein